MVIIEISPQLIIQSSMKINFFRTPIVFLCFLFQMTSFGQTHGPLRVHPDNPTCFIDSLGKTVITTGTHTWDNFQDNSGWSQFDYTKYINMMTSANTNFMRMWMWQLQGWLPAPFVLSENKADLTKFNPVWEARLRDRVAAARDKGIFVSLCLFWGHSSWGDRFGSDYFNGNNNINGIDGHTGFESQNLDYPEVTAAQENYVKQIIDIVNGYDNILFEIANEGTSGRWQRHMTNFIHNYEKSKPHQHLVMISIYESMNYVDQNDLYYGPNEVVASSSAYKPDNRISIWDSDHYTQGNFSPIQGWQAFLKGYFPIQMDQPGNALVEVGTYKPKTSDYAMGDMLKVGEKISREKMYTADSMSSTRNCLAAEDGSQFLVLKSNGGMLTLNLSQNPGRTFTTEWYNINTRVFSNGPDVIGGSSTQNFTTPTAENSLLILKGVALTVPATGMRFKTKQLKITVDKSVKLLTTFFPSNASNRKLTWTSSSDSIVEVGSSGVISFKTTGKCYIKSTTVDGNFKDTCFIEVINLPVTSFQISPRGFNLWPGDSMLLKPVIQPSDAAIDNLTWSSLNPEILKIDSMGLVNAIAVGSTKVVLSANGGELRDTIPINIVGENEFTNRDIGNTCVNGSTTSLNETITIKAGGSDIWDTSDKFQRDFNKLVGDGVLIVKVISLTNTNVWTKTGLMIRESNASGSKNAFIAVTSGNGTIFQARTITGGTTSLITTNDKLTAPYWLKLVRQGNVFTGYKSVNGVSWIKVGSVSMSMNSEVLAGLAATSHDDCSLTTAVFQNIIISNKMDTVPEIINVLPVISIHNPINYGNPVYINTPFKILVNANDPNDAVAKVEFYNGDTLIGTSNAKPFTLTATLTSVGHKSITAKAYDTFGASTVSDTVLINIIFTGIDNPTFISKVEIYPQPLTRGSLLTIKGLGNNRNKISVCRIDGKLLNTTDISNQDEVHLKLSLEPGVYLLMIQQAQKISTKKLIVN